MYTTATGDVLALGTPGHRRASFGAPAAGTHVESAARRMLMRRHAHSMRHLSLHRSRSAKTRHDHARGVPRRVVSFATPQPHGHPPPSPLLPFHAASDDVVLRNGGTLHEVDTPTSGVSGSGSVSAADLVGLGPYGTAGDTPTGRPAAVAANGPPPFTLTPHTQASGGAGARDKAPVVAAGESATSAPGSATPPPPPPPPDVAAPPPPPPPDVRVDVAAK